MPKAYVSSTISNFRDKLWKKYEPYRWPYDLFEPTIFFGLYGPGDVRRFVLHRGRKTVVWCGGDILRLTKHRSFWIRLTRAIHVCENEVEQRELASHNIASSVQPLFFGNQAYFPNGFWFDEKPNVYLSAHPRREHEYGVDEILTIAPKFPDITFNIFGILPLLYAEWPDNVIYHGKVTEEEFNEKTSKMQAGLRLNVFDGCSEVMAKALLRGQYAFSRIPYPGVATDGLIHFLQGLPYKKEPNPISRTWRDLFTKEIPV